VLRRGWNGDLGVQLGHHSTFRVGSHFLIAFDIQTIKVGILKSSLESMIKRTLTMTNIHSSR